MSQGFFVGQERIFEFSPRRKFWGLKAQKKAPDFLANITKFKCFLSHKIVQNVAEGVGFEPTCPEGKRFSRPPRYDHFDNPP